MKEYPQAGPCCKCGEMYETCYSNREDLLRRNMCFTCTFWQEYVEKKDDPRIARIKGAHWYVNPKTQHSRWNGMGGRSFTIRWNDGRQEETNDLWHQGTIPELFKDELPDNAEFVEVPAPIGPNYLS